MEISSQYINGVRQVRLSGELTIYAALEAMAPLMSALAAEEDLELDLEGISELDSAGVQLLLLARREAELRGCQLSLTRCSPAVKDLVRLYNLSEALGCQGLV